MKIIRKDFTMSKPFYIKTRCTENFKKRVEDFASAQNTSTSNIILSSVESALQCGFPTTTDQQLYFAYLIQYNILRNKVFNMINLDPNISENTREKIRKELDNYDMCKINCNRI